MLRYALLATAISLAVSCDSRSGEFQEVSIEAARQRCIEIFESERPPADELDDSYLPVVSAYSGVGHGFLESPWWGPPAEMATYEAIEEREIGIGDRVELTEEQADAIRQINALLEVQPKKADGGVRKHADDLAAQVKRLRAGFKETWRGSEPQLELDGPDPFDEKLEQRRQGWSAALQPRSRELTVRAETYESKLGERTDESRVAERVLEQAIFEAPRPPMGPDQRSAARRAAEEEIAQARQDRARLDPRANYSTEALELARAWSMAGLSLVLEQAVASDLEQALEELQAVIDQVPEPQARTVVTGLWAHHGRRQLRAAGGRLPEATQESKDDEFWDAHRSEAIDLLEQLEIQSHTEPVQDPRRVQWTADLAQLMAVRDAAPKRIEQLERTRAEARDVLNQLAQEVRDYKAAQLRHDVAIWRRVALE